MNGRPAGTGWPTERHTPLLRGLLFPPETTSADRAKDKAALKAAHARLQQQGLEFVRLSSISMPVVRNTALAGASGLGIGRLISGRRLHRGSGGTSRFARRDGLQELPQICSAFAAEHGFEARLRLSPGVRRRAKGCLASLRQV